MRPWLKYYRMTTTQVVYSAWCKDVILSIRLLWNKLLDCLTSEHSMKHFKQILLECQHTTIRSLITLNKVEAKERRLMVLRVPRLKVLQLLQHKIMNRSQHRQNAKESLAICVERRDT